MRLNSNLKTFYFRCYIGALHYLSVLLACGLWNAKLSWLINYKYSPATNMVFLPWINEKLIHPTTLLCAAITCQRSTHTRVAATKHVTRFRSADFTDLGRTPRVEKHSAFCVSQRQQSTSSASVRSDRVTHWLCSWAAGGVRVRPVCANSSERSNI